jgi:transposase
MKRPQDEVTLSPAEGAALIERLERNTLSAADRHLLVQVVRWLFWLLFGVQEAKLSLKRLRTLVFGKPSMPSKAERAEGLAVRGEAEQGRGAEPASARGEASVGVRGRGGHRPGQGRHSAASYAGAKRVPCRHEALRVGEICPVCGQGRLYTVPPGVELRIDGNALLSAVRSELEKLRCSACGAVFTAARPAAAGEEKYSPRARAVLAVSRYYLGLPLYRIASSQAMQGIPVPDATPWDQIERVADSGYVVFAHLEHLAAQGELISQDDTPVRILSLLEENQQAQGQAAAKGFARSEERTGMSTTALVVKVGERTLCLYYAGRPHAGENLAALLSQRAAAREKPFVMSDALSSHEVADESRLIRCHCLAHGRRKVSALEDVLPEECAVVIEALKQGFDHDEAARVTQMSPQARFAYHQAYSRPILDGLKTWLDPQFDEHLVEPNSSLGKAIAYMQGHWETLTRFFQAEGAPLDNNLVERALKLCIRQRKNSRFFATAHSAYIASGLTSLIATCGYAGVNALDYLVALQEHRSAVFRDPAAWRPWNDHANLVPPEVSCRQSCAIWAWEGEPFHNRIWNSLAARRELASSVWGPQVKRPWDRRLVHNQKPWPS